ncbi:hypothetical protein IWW38_003924, partial [Coemansia aciculifera]
EYLDDLATEMELLDDEEPVLYKIGDTFVKLTLEGAQTRLEKDKTTIDLRVDELDTKISDTCSEMDGLKRELYTKFGKAINLEKN